MQIAWPGLYSFTRIDRNPPKCGEDDIFPGFAEIPSIKPKPIFLGNDEGICEDLSRYGEESYDQNTIITEDNGIIFCKQR